MQQKAVRVRITGRVQGVGYRFHAQHAAEEHHICGWVRNAVDGAVEILAQGDPGELEAFLDKVKIGPRMSHVDNVLLEPIPVSTQWTTFRVRY